MLREKLLLAVAAIALIAGTGAVAQQENRSGPAEASAACAITEKSAPSTMSNDTTNDCLRMVWLAGASRIAS